MSQVWERSTVRARAKRVTRYVLVAALGAVLLAAGFYAVRSASSGASNPPPLGIYTGYDNSGGVSSVGSALGQ